MYVLLDFLHPDVIKDNSSNWNPNNKYSSIFNLCVPGDLISVIPGALGNGIYNPLGSSKKQWGKYGNSYWFAKDWNNIPTNNVFSVISAHDHGNYVNVFSEEMNVWEAKSYSDMKWQQWIKSTTKLHIRNYSLPLKRQLPSTTNVNIMPLSVDKNTIQSGIDIDIVDQSDALIASIRNNEIVQQTEQELLILITQDEEELIITVFGRNDIKYRLMGKQKKVNCMLSTYPENNMYTDCCAYYENLSLTENNTLEVAINPDLNNQFEKASEIVLSGKEIFSIPSTMFINSALYGDINLDNVVSVEDAQLTLNSYVSSMAGLESNLTVQQIQAADISGDESVSVDDAQLILLYYVKNTVSGIPTTWDELLEKSPSESS